MSSSRYWELSVETPEEASEGLTNFLWELGALGVIEEASEGRAPRLRAFFPKTLFARALEEGVREYLGGLAALGVPSVVAVDEDPDAVAAAMANAARNRVSDRVRCVLADAGALQETGVPVVVANLLTAAHLRLAPRYARYVAPGGGALVLGGILAAEAPGPAAALAGRGLAPHGSLSLEGWTTLTLRRGPGAPLHARA